MLRGEAKREYNNLRQRKLRLAAREREYEGEGGQQKGQHVKRKVVPDTAQIGGRTTTSGHINYSGVQQDLRAAPNPYNTKSAKRALDYMRYIAERGYTLDRATGELLDLRLFSQERLEALEEALRATQRQLAALQVDISMQRAEAILDDHLREVKEEYGG